MTHFEKNQNRLSTSGLERRRFVKGAAASLLAAGVWSEASARESLAANEKLNVLCIGTANRAAANIAGVESESIVGLCDVDSQYLDKAAARFPGARTYADYREMLATEAERADAVVIATTDHQHAPAAIRAINAGLHCYCEKPLTHTVEEARIITQAAAARGVATQMGTQIHAGSNYRRVVELIQAGAIGDVKEVHVWVGKGWGGGELPAKADPVPTYLDWDLWLGPAPKRPYADGRYHPSQWRRWWDFGQGTLGDMGCHYVDLPFWALDLKYPSTIVAEGPPVHPQTCPLGLTVRYTFAAEGKRSPLTLTWYDGEHIPKNVAGHDVPGSGVMFVGSEGELFANYSSYKLYPEAKFADFKPPAKSIPDSIGHHAEWIKACKEGTPTTCNFSYSGPLTETILLGNVAYRSGKQLSWDADKLVATNCPEAADYVRKEYRSGWEVEQA